MLNFNAKNDTTFKLYGDSGGWEDKLEIKDNGSKAVRRQWKCKFCKFSTTSLEFLTAHMIAVHWYENWNLKISVKIAKAQQQQGDKAPKFEETKTKDGAELKNKDELKNKAENKMELEKAGDMILDFFETKEWKLRLHEEGQKEVMKVPEAPNEA